MERVTPITMGWENERAQLVAERDEARTALMEFEEAAAIALQRQIEAAVGRVRQELGAECEEARQLLADTEEAAGIALERQLAAAREHIRSEQAAESEELRDECRKLKTELQETHQSLAEIREAYRRELSEHKTDAAERDRLVRELQEARAQLAEDPAAVEAIRTETVRIEALMQELSGVVRKTAERALSGSLPD